MSSKKQVGLIGFPIEHSLSPAVHKAAYAALGLDWEYTLYPRMEEGEFSSLVRKMATRPTDYLGFNVTTPFKAAALEESQRIDGFTAQTAYAINVLTFLPEGNAARMFIAGTNTDGEAISRFLENNAGASLSGVDAIVCGTGPTAAAAICALIQANASSITILSREKERVQEFVNYFAEVRYVEGGAGPDAEQDSRRGSKQASRQNDQPSAAIRGLTYNNTQGLMAVCANSTLIIDATPVGMNPEDEPVLDTRFITDRHTVLDVVYGFGETKLLQGARAQGARAYDGIGMLVEQAALTIEIWASAQGETLKAPRDIMYQAAFDELKRREQRTR